MFLTTPPSSRVWLPAILITASGCNLAPKVATPDLKLPVEFKTQGPWKLAQPKDHEARGNWWRLFGDAKLNE